MTGTDTKKQASEADIRTAFRLQAKISRNLGSPFVERLCELFSERLEANNVVATKLFNWPGDVSLTGDALPLRIVGALHALVLEGHSKELGAIFPPSQSDYDNDVLWSAISAEMVEHADFFLSRLQIAPQTNEVGRAAVLLPSYLTIASLKGLPLVLSEIGASAGLNLFWDRFGYLLGEMEWGDTESPVNLAPDWTGPMPPSAAVEIRERAGCDLSPLDPASHADRLRLLSYIWADQTDRIVRTRAALDIARQQHLRIEKADALDWLDQRLSGSYDGSTHILYHTFVWSYLSPEARDTGEAMIVAAGGRASDRSPLAWLRLEVDGSNTCGMLMLTLWPSGVERCIARADFHGRWINWFGWPIDA